MRATPRLVPVGLERACQRLSAGLKLPICGSVLEMMRVGLSFASRSRVLIFVWAVLMGTSALQVEELGLWQL